MAIVAALPLSEALQLVWRAQDIIMQLLECDAATSVAHLRRVATQEDRQLLDVAQLVIDSAVDHTEHRRVTTQSQ